ncbi:MAG: cytochrome-c peroxidase [Nitrospira sp. SG-bin2]|jgi:cobalt-zinc-cadmium resistance protein CzcA|uniref:efflux RND transporter permease subunit n=1 Tax=Nitrospira cf. moscoviensis SBR1015 TaxID=96242 RepID=UPI000A0D34F9|nr:CusA/CzcA family heavy metal efflux RND transporter [Nitrospira cf. moscoviensis SBR1015]OQW35298.1 MAG: cytochrome-c peroxidase [Nitrospira sp. SG-bin2]
MIASLLEFSLRQRILVIGLACLLSVVGLFAFQSIPIDAYPDVTNIQVQVLTDAPGLSPVEVERFITYPIELQMTGLPGLAEIRSLSKFALSQITVVFQDDVDIYFARQLVLERIMAAKERLPEGLEPVMAPVTTGLGEVYHYYFEGPHATATDSQVVERELMDQRTMQEWVLRPQLKSVPGVIDVNGMGGFVKQYQVLVDPAKLRKFDLTFQQIYEAVVKNNANVGGNVLERHAERSIVRGLGLIRTVSDIESIIVKEVGGTPVFVRDVGEVRIGHAVRHGAVVLNGEREVVIGTVLMLRGGNARQVVEAVKTKVEDLQQSNILPGGTRLIPFYDRIELVNAAIHTVRDALIEGIVLVIFIFFFFLGHVRSAIIVTVTLIVTPLVTFILMERFGLSANLMTLGGLAIAIGEIADGSLVVVENAYRHLAQHSGASQESRFSVILHATKEVGRPILFGILIISVVFLPLMTLQGMEGKMFAPLAYTLVIALLASVVVTLTLSPVLVSLLLRGDHPEETRVTRWMKQGYLPVLQWTLRHRGLILTCSTAIVLCSLALVPFVGREFIPLLEEGSLTPQVVKLPSVSLPESIEMEKQTQKAMLEFPEVKMAVSRIGRAEIPYHPEDLYESDPIVSLHDRSTWKTAATQSQLTDAIRKRLAEIPGISVLMSQPIQERVDELISGIRTQCAIKLFGDDLDVLRDKAQEIASLIQQINGVKDIKVEQVAGQPYLIIDIDRQKIARFGINVADVQEIVTTAIGGKAATQVYEGERRFQLTLRFPEPYRNSVATIGEIRVKSPSGALIPMRDLATIEMREGPARISREHVNRRIYIGFNVVGRDIGGVVDEGRAKLAAQLHLPQGYSVVWGGAFENMERANARLMIVVPITLGLVFFLLFWAFHSLRYATLIILNLPFALIGGVVSLWLSGQYLSVPASIGFIELFGLAVGNGIVLVSYINQLRHEGTQTDEAIITGCSLRLRPVVMTMMTTLLGLLPLALAQGIGAEVQRPLASVVIGGLFTSTVLTLVVLPALYSMFAGREVGKEEAPQWV